MSRLSTPIVHSEKPKSAHTWSNSINKTYSRSYKHARNSTKNPVYPKMKEKVPHDYRVRFSVIGNMMTKEFIYCSRLLKGLHSYKRKTFEAPVVKGISPIDWPRVLRDHLLIYGYQKCLSTRNCIVLLNDKLLGGMEELKNLIEDRYIYHLALNYQKESIFQFIDYLKASGRACAYMHISIDNKPIGSLIFMLYNDICPVTCNNFLRLCKSEKGGYSGTPVHRIVKDGWIQCGGFGLKEVPMPCENFLVDHDQRGILGMTNAGRHIECSTQFYVLLQPLPWMKYRYVAFGKLIEGEETLKKIEEVQTFNESPLTNIVIYRSGILNLDCQDITINKHANEYIDAHIEDLVETGDFFKEMLLEKVFLDIKVKELNSLLANFKSEEEEVEEEEVEEEEEEKIEDAILIKKSSLHDSERFLHKKNSQRVTDQQMYDKDNVDTEDTENVDKSIYEEKGEKMTEHFSSETQIRERKPFYIPLTDVPYPGEKDSHYDVKRLLRGDYCLESDLDPNFCKKITKKAELLLEQTSKMIKSYSNIRTARQEVVFLTDSQEEIIQEYLSQYREIASFGAETIRKIANQFVTDNPLESRDKRATYTDEDIRKIRLARKDVLSREQSRASVTVTEAPWEVHMQIKRRQTGFIKAVDLTKIHLAEDEEDEIDYESDSRFISSDEEKKVKITQKPAGEVPKNLNKLEIIDKEDEEINDESSFELPSVVPSGVAFHPSRQNVDEEDYEAPVQKERMRRPTAFVWPIDQDDDDDEDDENKADDENNYEKKPYGSDDKPNENADNIDISDSKTIKESHVAVDVNNHKKSEKKSAKIIIKIVDENNEVNDDVDVNYYKENEEYANNDDGNNDKENEGKVDNVDGNNNKKYEGKADEVKINDKNNEEKVDKGDANNKKNELKAANGDDSQLASANSTSKRISLLDRLYDEVALDETNPGGPTLKNYTPMSKLKKQILLLKSRRLSDVFEDKNIDLIRKPLEKGKSVENFLAQYGSNVTQTLSTDYIMAISKAERLPGNSLRTLEYQHQRPSLSVSEYKDKYRRENRNVEEHPKKTSKYILLPDSSSVTTTD